jgi:CubicO group peptidase (beta-lactamase class C family)
MAAGYRFNKVKPTETLEKWHKDLGTVAFLVIKNDSLWSESYYDGYDKDSKSNSFSMAKSVVSAALGKAISQGKKKASTNWCLILSAVQTGKIGGDDRW